MSRTQHFVRQHREILGIANQIQTLLDEPKLRKEAGRCRILLGSLAGKLRAHLAMEDEGLYPRLLSHADPQVRDLARAFVDEMGGLRDTFIAYVDRYATADAIGQAPARFIADTRALFTALSHRIAREDSELYPLLDRVG